MPTAELFAGSDGPRIYVKTQFRDKEAIKQVPGIRWDKQAEMWHAPRSWAACLQLRGIFGDRLDVGPALAAWSQETRARVDYLRWLRGQEDAPGAPDLWAPQRVAVQFLLMAGRALLGDEMGSGKTRSAARALLALAAALLADLGPVLVVAPKSVKRPWARELRKAGLTVALAGATAKSRQEALRQVAEGEAQVLVINWDALRAHSRLAPYGSVRLAKCAACAPDRADPVPPGRCETCPRELNAIAWQVGIFDEVHRAKDPKSKQTRAAKAAIGDAPFRWGLSGTPLGEEPHNLWSIMNLLVPEEYPARTAFIERYCEIGFNPHGGLEVLGLKAETKEELFGFLDPRFLRRLKAETMPWLPPKVPGLRHVTVPPKLRKAYKDLAEGGIAEVEGGDVLADNPLTLTTRLSQLASASLAVDPDTGQVRLCEPSPKVDGLVELLEDRGFDRATGALPKAVVAYTPSRQLLELCEARLTKLGIPWVSIHGGVSEEGRDQAEQRFMSGEARVMLLNSAGAEGLTLTAADTFVYLQRDWSLKNNAQAEDRIHRPGAEIHERLYVIDLVAEGTIEEYMHERLVEKGERLEEVLRDRERLLAAARGETCSYA